MVNGKKSDWRLHASEGPRKIVNHFQLKAYARRQINVSWDRTGAQSVVKYAMVICEERRDPVTLMLEVEVNMFNGENTTTP